MKRCELLDASSAQVLGFEWLTSAIAPVSPYGERVFSTLRPFAPGEEAQAQARATTIAATAERLGVERIDAARGALRVLPDVSGAVAGASMGETLDDPSLLELLRFCVTIGRIDALLSAGDLDPIANDAVDAVATSLAPGRHGEFGFYLADAFDAELTVARERLAREQAQLDALRGREIERVARELRRDAIESDEFIVMRADLRGQLPTGIRVVREAPTYLLCTLEYGDAALKALERRDGAVEQLAVVEERVRRHVCATIREHAQGLTEAAAVLGELDVLLGAAVFMQRYHCLPAAIVADRVLSFERARFLPLEAELAAAGRLFVPLEIQLHDPVVLTGPNMGGKSVCLQTAGFVALCAAFGLPVPAESACCGLFDQIAWLGMGREAQIGGLLSSFAREVLDLKAILGRSAPRLLILADEFARTTTPHEGQALLVALLAWLREHGACGMVATHLSGIAAAAGARHFALRGVRGILAQPQTADVGEALRALADAMDYTIAEVADDAPPRADAIALTALLGVDAAFVDAAQRALVQ